MKVSKRIRKDCLGCKCSETFGCQLKYKTTTKSIIIGITKRVPLECCPKPLTNRDWLKAREDIHRR